MTVTAYAQRKVIYLKGHMTPAHFSFLNACPGFKKFTATGAVFAATRIHLELFHKQFPDAEIEDSDGTLAALRRVVAPITAHERLTASKMPLFAHQRSALDCALSRDCFAFFHEMGTGKTATALHIAAELAARGEIDRAIIVAPKRVVPQTVAEQIPAHMPAGVDYCAGVFPHPKTKRAFANAKLDKVPLLIAVAGYGQLQSVKSSQALLEFAKGGPCAALVDESHFVKNPSTVRAKSLEAMKPHLKRRYIFTGTPSPNGPVDLFGQFRFLDENIIGHASMTSFKNQFCIMGGFENREIVAYRDLDDLSKAIAPHCQYVRLDDVMDMPEKLYDVRSFEPDDEQADLYDTLKKDFVIAVDRALAAPKDETETITKLAKNAAAKLTAMAQVAAGFFYADGPEEGVRGELVVLNDDRAKFVVEDVIGGGEEGPKVVVFCRFHGSLDSMARALRAERTPFVELSGRRNDRENGAALHAFQNDPQTRVLVTTAAAGGTGLNLQIAHHAVFFENGYNLAHRLQAEARIWRTGQHNRCHYADIVAFPIDRAILGALRKKTDLAREIEMNVSLARLAELKDLV